MKLLTLITATFLVLGLSTAQANNGQLDKEKEIQVNINNALVPSTANAYENVKAVISGVFPNGCYTYSHSEVLHNNNSLTHKVATFAKVNPGMCIMVLVPFTREVELGSFAPGKHKVRFVNADETYQEKVIVVQ